MTARRLRVPEHVHLLFLPPHSPELQPAEHLWPLTNTVLVNRHFATIEELEDAQAERCVALQAPPRPHPLHDPVPLVAAAHSSAPRSTAILTHERNWEPSCPHLRFSSTALTAETCERWQLTRAGS